MSESKLFEEIRSKSDLELLERYNEILPIIKKISGAWEAKDLDAEMVLSWQFGDNAFRWQIISINAENTKDALRQFIHDFCTNLCGEKMMIETVLDARKQITLDRSKTH